MWSTWSPVWFRRTALSAAMLPLVLFVTWDVRYPVASASGPSAPEVRRQAPAPSVVSRGSWGADESLNTEPVLYTGQAKAVFIHHTDHADDYDCEDVPAMLKAMHADQVRGRGWDDLGYNFIVDKCGTVYEGRAGGVNQAVTGAHTKGFNADTVGIAALGSFDDGGEVPAPMLEGMAKVAAWKLRLDTRPGGRVRLVSSNDASLFEHGETAEMFAISGHRDAYSTACPGDALYERLPEIRDLASRMRRR